MTSASALQTPDILILILSLLDPTTLASFRLTSPRINSIIIAHQKSICNSIALRTFSTSFDFLPSPNSLLSSPGLDKLHINALLRMPRALLLADRAIIGCNAMGRGCNSRDWPAYKETCARCTRGILVFWALVDIQESVSPNQVPAPNYKLEAPVALGPVAKRWKNAAQLFSPRTWVSTRKSPSTTPRAVPPAVHPADTPPARVEGCSITPNDLSAASVAQRLAAVKAAQAPFVALLTRSTRIDLEVAQGFLHTLMPNSNSGLQPNSPLYMAQHSWWRESWALRQGPAFMLAVSSADARERAWTNERMEQEFKARSREVVEMERTTPIFLFEDKEMGKDGTRPLWAEAWDVRGGK
ncbi:hypothetical protein MMC17_001059 [Xylographa soralifera]|nr:hypothetical protein [Xylographa soralifera]